MPRQNINSLLAFRAVALERSFTRAAAQIGVSPSALSHTIRALEERLGLRLLTRTTRSVVPSDVGERLLGAIGPHFDGIETELTALSELRDKPAGSIRITTGVHAAQAILWPALAKLLPIYPDIEVELSVHSGFIDIVAERFDAGVRLGETIAQDMVAVRIGPDIPHGRRWLARLSSPPASPLERRTTSQCIIASTCAFPPAAGFTRGNSKKPGGRSTFGSKGR